MFSSPLNYLTPFHRYSFTITATQSFPGRPSVSSTATAQINLGYCNIYAPTFINPNAVFTINAALSVGISFGTMFATDGDKDSVVFSLSASSQFIINRSTGVLSLNQLLSTGSVSSFTLTVTATDVPLSSCASPCPTCTARSTSTTITITVTTANKEPPRFLNQLCGLTFSLPENSPMGTSIIMLTAMDSDLGVNGQISFSFPPDPLQTRLVTGVSDSQSKETFYSKFQLNQFTQISDTRTVQLQTNQTFDYDQPGELR